MQSILDRPREHLEGGRRGSDVKMGWTKTVGGVYIFGEAKWGSVGRPRVLDL